MWNRNPTHPPSRWPACLGTIAFCVALLLSLAGCSGTGEMVLAGTEDDALEVLTAALDAWKAGQEPDELQNENPPVFVRDADWMEGRNLKAFEAHEAPREHGGEWKVFARLTLTGGDRAEEQKLVAYSVTTETKAVVITRSDNVD
jgi:hypothetical protein